MAMAETEARAAIPEDKEERAVMGPLGTETEARMALKNEEKR
jgi:hypothetical protein